MSMGQRRVGTKQVIVLRLVRDQLPLLIEIKTHVDQGLRLKDGELEIMSRMTLQARRYGTTAERFPDLRPLLAKMIELNEQITRKALENESA